MDSIEIRNLVRACNAVAGGAITYFKSGEVRLFEVEAIPLTSPPEVDPGTVATISNDPSLYVMCKDSAILRLSVLAIREAVCSGVNFKKMLGVTSGEKFTSQMMQSAE